MVTTEQLSTLKGKLEAEKKFLKEELAKLGKQNPDNPADWEATATDLNTLASDENEVSDSIEEFETNTAVLKQLEIRFNEVGAALKRIQNKTYGLCEVDSKPIEAKRLEANPAATTCLEHMK